ncbi:hypothetical protein MRX96_018649 [Rhipicephalus microplus]
MRPLLMSSKALARRASFLDICEIAEKERRQTYYEEESQRGLLGCEEPGGHVDTVTGFAKPPIGLESGVCGALTHEEQAGNIDAVTGSNKPPYGLEYGVGGASTRKEPVADVDTMTSSDKLPGGMEPGVGEASTEKTPSTKTKQVETKESEPSASADFRLITLSEEQHTHLLQSYNWPIQSKSIISIQQEKAEPSCKFSGGQEPLTSQRTLTQQTMALQTPTH